MIYPTFGISIISHVAVILAAKIKNFFEIALMLKKSPAHFEIREIAFFRKILLSLAIVFTMSSVLFLVIGSSLAILYIGITSPESNYNLIRDFIAFAAQI